MYEHIATSIISGWAAAQGQRLPKCTRCLTELLAPPPPQSPTSAAPVGHSQVLYAALELTSAKHKTKLFLKTDCLLVYPNILQGSDI